jgi:iron complex transport system ATP-binding protein
MAGIAVHQLAFGYNGHRVLDGVELHAPPGRVTVLIGPNGAGKTTLLKLIAGLLRPQVGEVQLDGRDVQRISARHRAQSLAVVPQLENQVWPLTVGQLVALGRAPHRGWMLPLNAADRAIIDAALARTDLTALRDRPITALSGGERQLALIARALAQQPDALLLDEPTSHLDMRHQATLMELARTLAHRDGLTVVMTLHDVNQAALYADHMVLLAEGTIQSAGTPEAVLRPALLSRVYDVPVTVTTHPVHGTPMVVPIATTEADASPNADMFTTAVV